MSHKAQYLKAGTIWLRTLPQRGDATFEFAGETYPYFRHLYNVTWLNERRVEIPIIRRLVAREGSARTLEVGNVLSHYDESLVHPVVDRYEQAQRANLFSEDAETFTGEPPYDLIVSISTFEHIGQDETPRDDAKIARTMLHLRSLLADDGSLVFTAPVGYSPPLDRLVDAGEGFTERRCLRRVNAKNEWVEADWSEVRNVKFHDPYPFANAIVVARVGPASV
jgi:hypothetical protein